MKKEKPHKESHSPEFTVTEVGTLMESIRKEIKIVAEGHGDLDRRFEKLEIEVHGNSERLDMVKLTNAVINNKVTHLENAVSKLNKDLRKTKEELKNDAAEIKGEIRGLGNRLSTVETR